MSKPNRPPPQWSPPFYIVSGFRFYQQADRDRAIGEAVRLSRANGRKFYVFRVVERFSVAEISHAPDCPLCDADAVEPIECTCGADAANADDETAEATE